MVDEVLSLGFKTVQRVILFWLFGKDSSRGGYWVGILEFFLFRAEQLLRSTPSA